LAPEFLFCPAMTSDPGGFGLIARLARETPAGEG
jgi:hypothetical protein